MLKGMRDMAEVALAIDKIIGTPSGHPSKEEATKVLRSCGILDRNNNIKPAYRKILIDGNKKIND